MLLLGIWHLVNITIIIVSEIMPVQSTVNEARVCIIWFDVLSLRAGCALLLAANYLTTNWLIDEGR